MPLELKTPTVAYWCGERLDEMPVPELVEIITQQAKEIERLRAENHRRSVQHIHDLADMARERHRSLLSRIFA